MITLEPGDAHRYYYLTNSQDPLLESLIRQGLRVHVQYRDHPRSPIWASPDSLEWNALPTFGIKLHISATICNALETWNKVRGYLNTNRIFYKVAASTDFLGDLNSGIVFPFCQVGKFITVYPESEDKCVEIAMELRGLLEGSEGPNVPSDRRIWRNAPIYYRFGKFVDSPQDAAPSLEDSRRPESWPLGYVDPFSERQLLDIRDYPYECGGLSRYAIQEVLSQRGKGGVYSGVALEDEYPVVIKEARPLGEMESNGVDARDRIKWQQRVLGVMRHTSFVPEVLDFFEQDEHYYLVMQRLDGNTLAGILRQGITRTIEWRIRSSIALCDVIAKTHSESVLLVDVSPSNLIATEDGRIKLFDLEHSWMRECDLPIAKAIGVHGFYPYHIDIYEAPSVGRDLYGAAAVIYLLFSSEWSQVVGRRQSDPSIYWNRAPLDLDVPAHVQEVLKLYLDETMMKIPSSISPLRECLIEWELNNEQSE